MYQRTCVLVAAVVGFSTGLSAQELDPAGGKWSGLYAGIHAGYGWGDTSMKDGGTAIGPGFQTPTGAFACGHALTGNYCNNPLEVDAEGMFGGLQIGANWQRGQLVLGIEGEIGKLGISETKTLFRPFNDRDIGTVDYDNYGTVTAKLGYDLAGSLFYIKGGLALAEIENKGGDIDLNWGVFKIYQPGYTQTKGVRTGWALGGGWEHYIADQVSFKAEYLFMDFGSETSYSADGDIFVHENELHTVKVGLNFHDAPHGGAAGPQAPVTYDWSGLYIGAHGGYGFGDIDYTLIVDGVVTEDVSHDTDGWLYGGHVGVQRQYGRVVAGLEVSYSELDLSDTVPSAIGGGRYRSIDVDSLVTVAARVGLARDSWLAYVKGGYATADVDTAIFKAGSDKSVTGGWEDGWTIGAGIELSCLSRFIVGLEYDYVKLDIDQRTGVLPDHKEFHYQDADDDIHSVVARVSYKLGSEPAPAPLK